MQNPEIVRNRAKIEATIANACNARDGQSGWAFLELRRRQPAAELLEDGGGGSRRDAESKAMSKELKRRGFRFVGPTICYAFMQAVGMVNDHTAGCFRYAEVQR